MRALVFFTVLIGAILLLKHLTAPDQEAASIASQFKEGDSATNILYMTATQGFEIIRFFDGKAEYVRGDRRGQQANISSSYYYPYGDQIEDVCQGRNCVFFTAKRIDWPLGSDFKLKHVYEIGWVERDGILQAVGQKNIMYFYPIL
ncbi:hypothetical protein [Sulfitobacter mediterraneus]|nr:hypothetical protein [Sulfitobacter mediterraneus]